MSRVAVLQGGRSLERRVSLRSGERVQDSLERLGHEVLALDVGHDLVRRLRAERPDAAFVALHGREGEDGTVQELLELLEIPYTGPGAAACARCTDKVATKRLLREAGVPTPPAFAFDEAAFKELGAADALDVAGERLGFPVVVKPASGGSALGIKVARDAVGLAPALVAAFSYDRRVLLERHVDGIDLAVSLLDGEPLPVVEAVPVVAQDGYDYEARYEIGATEFRCPAGVPAEAAASAQELAVATWRATGCRGFARVDLLRDRASGELTVLEINAVPGLTETSLLPIAAQEAGMDLDALVERALALATLDAG